MNEHHVARNLAFFSIALGLAELLAPRAVARLIGISEEHDQTIRLLGLRELTSGIGIMQGKPQYFLWSRVAGDAMDLGLLGSALKSDHTDRQRLESAMVAVAVVTVADVVASVLHSRRYEEPGWRDPRPMESRRAIARENPMTLRASVDDAMRRHQSGHVLEMSQG